MLAPTDREPSGRFVSRGLVAKRCEWCGSGFSVMQYRRDSARFCSLACLNAWQVQPAEDRFWAAVSPEPNTGCWVWTGSVFAPRMYGSLHVNGRGNVGAHRFSFEMHVRPLAPGEVVCHRCDNEWCVNPRHLFAGTQGDNVRDMVAKKRNRPPLAPERKLTRGDVAVIRALLKEGVAQRLIAERFGVRRETISKIKTGALWREPERIDAVIGRVMAALASKAEG